ncbi:SAM-dependent methyltransferase [Nocardia neocaledoniensis]|uniref:SAM-dependent methyltransferase n=1 Tax=Nocardia neocaledoniensis TaxID=236511 RepID=UPI00245423BD|nr:SAM-dependent methyltransferase [Nocardia neocaledoniensis]
MDFESAADRVDVSKPHPARRYDYWLGGSANFEADRASADAVAEAFPSIHFAVLENRSFLRRAVPYLVETAGIRQFLDIGTGLPTAGNVHELAQDLAPECRVVYVDNDPIVLYHARELLHSTPEGATAYIDADLREPSSILAHPALAGTLDLDRPVALMLCAVLHFLTDAMHPYDVVRELCAALPSGSYLTMTHATDDHLSVEDKAASIEANERSGVPFQLRSTAEFTRFFDGLELVCPGIVSVIEWRPTSWRPHPRKEAVSMLGAVARIP